MGAGSVGLMAVSMHAELRAWSRLISYCWQARDVQVMCCIHVIPPGLVGLVAPQPHAVVTALQYM